MSNFKIYETFCRLHCLNTVKKRGSVILRERDNDLENMAIDNYFNAIIKAADESTALESVILVALRDLSGHQLRQLSGRLREYCASATRKKVRQRQRVAAE